MGTDFLESEVGGSSQETERKQAREVHSQTEERRGKSQDTGRRRLGANERHSQTGDPEGGTT